MHSIGKLANLYPLAVRNILRRLESLSPFDPE
jgi:hypothetical protein